MKYCEEYAALLDLFVDGELPPGEMERVRAHLEACPGCRAYVDDALAIRAGFPEAEDTAVPEGFAGGVMERIRRDAERKRKAAERKRARHWAGTFGALAACCALAVLVRTGSGGLKRAGSDSAAVVTAGAGADAPTVYDMDGGAAESGTVPETAMEEVQYTGGAAPEEQEEREETRMAAAAGGEAAKRDAAKMASTFDREGVPAAGAPAAAPAEAAEAAPEAVNDAAGDEEAALYLTAGEAGDLLDGFTPVREDSVSSRYELSAEEYRALLKALERPEEPRETGEGTFTVVVKWALE